VLTIKVGRMPDFQRDFRVASQAHGAQAPKLAIKNVVTASTGAANRAGSPAKAPRAGS